MVNLVPRASSLSTRLNRKKGEKDQFFLSFLSDLNVKREGALGTRLMSG